MRSHLLILFFSSVNPSLPDIDISMTVIFVVYALKRSTMAREIGQQRLIWISQGIPLSYHIGLTPKRNLSYVIVEEETLH